MSNPGPSSQSTKNIVPVNIEIDASGIPTATALANGQQVLLAQLNSTRTGFVDPVTNGNIPYPFKRLSVEVSNINNVGARPSGADWLFSATQDLDTFTSFLQFEPTVFFDPSDTTSLNYGTEEEPYNTRADVNRYMAGNRAGCVLGIKRGTHLYNTSSVTAPLNFSCYGSQASPVLVVPYGDPTQPMPIIDGSYVTGSGSYVWAASTGSIWRVAVAFDTDVFENGVRCQKKSVIPAAPGECQYTGGYLYYWPRITTNPNDGTLKINYCDHAVALTHPDFAGQAGNVKFIGIDIRHSRYDAFWSKPAAGIASLTSLGATDVLFCRVGHAGYDANLAGTTSTDGIIIYGVHATLRVGTTETISSRIIGNEIYDCTHNPVEFAAHDNGLCEYNYIHDSWGAGVEYWHDCSNNVFRNNFVENMSSVGHIYGLQGAFAYLFNYTAATQAGSPTYDDTHNLNINNQIYNNYFKNCSQNTVTCNGGGGATATTPHKVYNNTFDIDHDAIYGTDLTHSNLPSGLYTVRDIGGLPAGTVYPANGFLVWSNNLVYYRYAPTQRANGGANNGYLNTPFVTLDNSAGTAKCVPIGNYNCYFQQTGANVAPWIYGGINTANFTTYKTAMVGFSFDQNSRCAYGAIHPIYGAPYGNSNGGNTTIPQLNYTEATGKPGSGSVAIQGGTNVNANRLTDYIGQTVLAVATPAIGCYER